MIVGHITGLSIAQLMTAPTIDEVAGQISVFFEDNPLIIGHNVAFDLSFLHRFFPQYQTKLSIDTYQLAQACIHYAPSYALESLISHIESKSQNMKTSFEFHDALQDCLACAHLLQYMTTHISKIARLYGVGRDSNIGLLRQLANNKVRLIMNKPLPALTSLTPDNTFDAYHDTHDSIDLSICQQHGQYFVGNLTLEDYLI
jgi:DNA polymerase III epsilon subunit-like protein